MAKSEAVKMKTCFVISPIGAPNSDVRRRADCLLEYIIKPAFSQLGFDTPERIDETDEAGQITIGIIKRIYESDLVVADLSGRNPNVMYEIGIRHAFQKPIIHVADDLTSIPFDNANQNTIDFIHDDPRSHANAIQRIVTQVKKITDTSGATTTPVSVALGQMAIESRSENKGIAIENAEQRLEKLEASMRKVDLVFSNLLKELPGSTYAENTSRHYYNALTRDSGLRGRSIRSVANALASGYTSSGSALTDNEEDNDR